MGTDTYCLTCGYINGISIVYLYNARCGLTCPDGTWYDSVVNLDHRCSPCHEYCSICTGPLNSQCSACSNSTNTSAVYYKYLTHTTCNTTCPDGSFIDPSVPNFCVACDSKCVRCNITSTTCYQCSFNYYLDEQNNNCTALCPSGQYNDQVITPNYYYCRLCSTGCATCTGPGLTVCQSCLNVTNSSTGTVTSYYKEVTGDFCVLSCSVLRYFGNALNNMC